MSNRLKSKKNFPVTALPQAGRIKPSNFADDNPDLKFSFKHLDLKHDKFDISKREPNYFSKVFERLKNLSSVKMRELLANRSSALRAHPIDWSRTSEPEGFSACLNEHYMQLSQEQPYQFEISVNQHGRVHGFILDEVFYIVWLDPDHLLFPGN